MALKINVTWPERLPQVCIPIDCDDMEPTSEKATKEGAHITIDGAFGQGNRVCDHDRYRISRESQSPLECCRPCATYDYTLVILLESPHRDEYLNNCIDQPQAPALGSTGRNVRKHLMDVVNSCCHIRNRLDKVTRVILANPIQFQCSLVWVIESNRSNRWKEVRDAVWKALWNQQAIRNECRERLKRHNPNFIINACTHDLECKPRCLNGDQECRKRKVHDFLVENFPCAHIYAASHPSTWNIPTLRILQFIQ